MVIPELTAAQLLQALESNAAPQVLDVRAPERAARGHIEAPTYFNLPGSLIVQLHDATALGLDRGRPVVVVCDRGIASRPIAQLLLRQGFDVRSLAGGMLGWMLTTARRSVPEIAGLDRLFQLDRIGKGALGYLAVRAGEALVVDPGRDLATCLDLIEECGARLVGVVDTHCHADYLSGGPALAAARSVPYYLHPADAIDPYTGRAARIDFSPLADGFEIAVGDARFTVEHMPGHTAGSVALRLRDELVFSGDFLFVASVGRPDLADRTDRTAEWTELLFQSLSRAKREWNPRLRIFPAHYGAASERKPSRLVEASFGDLAARNPPLGIADPAAFAAWVGARTTAFPEEYRLIKQVNLGLLPVDPELADELEAGKNQCALAG